MKQLFSLLLSFIVFSVSAQQAAISAKIDPLLAARLQEKGTAEFLVVMKAEADLSAAKGLKTKEAKGQYVFETLQKFAKNSQADLLSHLQQWNVPFQSFWLVNVIKAKGDLSLIQTIAAREDVKQVNLNSVLYYHKPVEEGVRTQGGSRGIEWGIQMIKADSVWMLGYTGQGVVVGGQDTGYDWQHAALKDKYRGWNGTTADHNYNWHDAIHQIDSHSPDSINPCGLSINFPCDDDKHGTHTMGTMVGLDGTNQIGLAYSAKWVGVRNMERGYGTPASYIEAFQWFIAPTDLSNANPLPTKAPDVINNSWGCPPTEGCDPSNFSVMEQVVNNTKSAGIVVVVSAGNDGKSCSTVSSPAAIFESSFSVGATNWQDNIANFSSRGPVTVDNSGRMKPNVSAPGVFVNSCVPGGNYQALSGTSMAGPHVAGAVALLLSAAPTLKGNVDSVEHILEMTAKPLFSQDSCGNDLPTSLPNNTYGYGRIDIYAAVKMVVKNLSNSPTSLAEKVHIFPNPAKEQLFIELMDTKEKADLILYNASGQKVISQSLNMVNTISLLDLPSGIYFYHISLAEGMVKGKFVKE